MEVKLGLIRYPMDEETKPLYMELSTVLSDNREINPLEDGLGNKNYELHKKAINCEKEVEDTENMK